MGIKEGNNIKIEYTGSLDDGTVFDSSARHGKPLDVQIGNKQLIGGFEKALMGMEKDQEKDIRLEPKDAYGDYNPELVKEIPKEKIPNNDQLKEGLLIGLTAQDGQTIPAMVNKITDDMITLDLNHPLAGKTLNFKVKVVEVS